MHFRFVHDFQSSPQHYWETFFSEEYSRDLYKKLSVKSQILLSQTVENQGAIIRRSQKLEPSLLLPTLPDFARSMVPDFSYIEHCTYFRDRSLMEVQIEPNTWKDKFYFIGIYTVLPLDQNRCRRNFQGELNISIPLLGKKIERFILEQFTNSEPVTVKVTEEWLARRP